MAGIGGLTNVLKSIFIIIWKNWVWTYR